MEEVREVDTEHSLGPFFWHEDVEIIERDEVEFRVVDGAEEDLESRVVLADDEDERLVSSGATIEGENPLDVQSRYLAGSESTPLYSLYDAPYTVATDERGGAPLTIEHEEDRVRSVTNEILQKKVQAIAGALHTEHYANEHQQAQMGWYKRVNMTFLMFLYDVT